MRAAAAANQAAACERANLTADEIACMGRATDTWKLKDCAPRMFPSATPAPATDTAAGSAAGTGGGSSGSGGADCKTVVARIRDAVVADMGSNSGSAGLAMVDKMIAIMERACTEDQWPDSVRNCIVQTSAGNMAAVATCNGGMSKDLQDKLAKRMALEMPPVKAVK